VLKSTEDPSAGHADSLDAAADGWLSVIEALCVDDPPLPLPASDGVAAPSAKITTIREKRDLRLNNV
jgi:hypothetical protein